MNVIIEHKNSTRLSEGGPAHWLVEHWYFFPYMASSDIELVDYLNGLALLMGKKQVIHYRSETDLTTAINYYCLVSKQP